MRRKYTQSRQQFVRLCDCGCGQPTLLASSNHTDTGVRKGVPQRFVYGHQSRKWHDDNEHFDAELDKSGRCWIYTGNKTPDGYGSFRTGSRTDGTRHTVRAHRYAYERAYGPIPDGLCVLHNCPDGDNPACCNPAHLWLGTRTDNNADRVAKGRSRSKFRERLLHS